MSQRIKISILAPLALMLLGTMWAFASPHGSSNDEEFHLTNIWCAWGDSEVCTIDPSGGGAFVPENLYESWCYARWPAGEGAGCLNDLTSEPVLSPRYASDISAYSPLYFDVMRVFAGENIAFSVQVMRVFNVSLASVLMFWVLSTATWFIKRGFLLSWGVGLVPVGIFYLASVNPSSWLIIGVGTFWAFLASALTAGNRSRKRTWYLWLGAAVSAIIAIGAKTDGAMYIGISVIAVGIWRWRYIRQELSLKTRLSLSLIAVVILILSGLIFTRRYSFPNLSFPGAQTSTDQPVPALKTLLEVPSFVFGLFGGQSAQTVMANSPDVQGLDGWRPVGFIQGIGWTDTQLPSMVGLFVTLVAFAVVIVAIRRFTPERIIAVGFLLFAFLAVLFGYRALYDFSTAAFFQPRYLIPLTLVVLGVAYSTSIHQIFNKLQGSIIFIMLFSAGSVAWLATATRYAVGPNAAYTNFGQPTVWWWESGPGRMAWFILSSVALAIWIYVAVFSPLSIKHIHDKSEDNLKSVL